MPRNEHKWGTPSGVGNLEWLLPLAVAVFMALIGSVPYWAGYAAAGEEEVFMGFVGRGTTGAAGYMMLAKQGMEGHVLFENRITSEPTARAYFNLEWLLFGRMAAWFGVSLVFMFHVWRIASAFLLVFAVYYLIRLCIPDVRLRMLSLLLLVFGAGFGWIVFLANHALGLGLPVPHDASGVTVFAHLINKPHFIRGCICAALTVAFLIKGEQSGLRRYFVYSGLAASLHGFIRPFHIPETYLLFLGLPVLLCLFEGRISKKRLADYGLAALVFLPVTVYLLLTAHYNVLGMSGWHGFSVYLLQLVLWLGFPFSVCAIVLAWGGVAQARQWPVSTVVLAAWLFIAWVVANAFPYYSPGAESSYYAFVMAPSILFFCGPCQALLRLAKTYAPPLRPLLEGKKLAALAAVFLVLSVPSNALNYRTFFTSLHAPKYLHRYYLTKDEVAALAWVGENTHPDEVLLASIDVAQFVNRFGNNRVFAGHELYTPDFYDRLTLVNWFYLQSDNLSYKRWLVGKYNISYVFYGPYERRIGNFEPETVPWLEKVFEAGEVVLYRVVLE